ncbi:MAG TPA: efflux RND transporter periplasmic adaptor subunit [Candidatus Udaeobacter sp.]|nr:efflux RND transporter periplasmic adaptor subunit [Candidatus Udaeobacter sp.]
MKRKKLVIVLALIALIGGGTGIYFASKKPTRSPAAGSPAAGKAQGSRKIKYYKSTMMLGQISLTPQKDSMGMDMVPVYEDEAGDTSIISIDPVTVQNMGVRIGTVTRGPLRRIVRTVGRIQPNETALTDVTTKFKGWIEKLYVDATGKEVKKGEPLFDIYSPDLYSAQNEYLLALKGPANLKQSALTRLKYFDISDEQIAELEKTRKGTKTLQVKVPADGVVLEKMAVEGQMVEAGMKLYRLADLSIVWLQSQIYEQDLAYVRLGQEAVATLSYLPDRKFRGRVTYVYPTVDEKTRTAQVRMEFHNPGLFLKPGMFATVELEAELEPSTLLVPDTAILRSGAKTTVFVALEGGKFEPRTVTLGPRSENNLYQVLSGLNEGERVVTSGQFMLDSESQLREAIQKMIEPTALAKPSEHTGHKMSPQTETHAGHEAKEKPEAIAPTPQPSSTYICPMPEHASIEYEHPGKCPICGMTLIPKPNESSAAAAPEPPKSEHQH